MKTIPIQDLGQGVNKDLLPSELAPGMLSDVSNFRSRAGFLEKWEGVSTVYTAGALAYWMQIMALSTAQRIVVTGGAKFFYYNPATTSSTNITRYVVEQTVTTATRIGANTAEFNTGAAHSLTTNDVVTTFGFTEAGYNVTAGVVTVMDTDTFRLTTTTAIASNATVMGTYVVTSSSAQTDFTSAEFWTGGVLNGNLVVGNYTDGLFFWPGSGFLRKFNFKSYKSVATFVFGNYIVQLAPNMDGVLYPNRVLWSNAAIAGGLPTSFTPAATNDSRYEDLNGAALLVTGKQFREASYVFSKDGCYVMRYVGGALVHTLDRIDDYGCIGRWAVANTPVGQVFVTPALDIRVHNGGASRSIAEGVIRTLLPSTADLTSLSERMRLVVNQRKNELWVILRSPSSSFNDRILVGSWPTADGEPWRWSVFNIPGGDYITTAAEGIYPGYGSNNNEQNYVLTMNASSVVGAAGGLTQGTGVGQWYGNNLTGTAERTGLHFGDYDTHKTLDGVLPNVDATAAATATWYTGSSKTADGTVTWTSGATHTVGTTKYVDQRATAGPFVGWKVSTTAYPYLIRSMNLRFAGGAPSRSSFGGGSR